MRSLKSIPWVIAFTFILCGIATEAATLRGTVTNKTTNKPSAGDTVVLVDVQAGMTEAARATTNASGQYTLDTPGIGPYLIRVNHQGGTYFIAAPQGEVPGNVTVYDVAPKVDGVGVDADMLLVEAAGGMLRVHERFQVRNTSLPPRAQFGDNTFEVVIPVEAEIDSASATRPGGLSTNTHLVPLSEKGHYTFNIPIQPDQGEKQTLFEVQYHISYSGKYTFVPHLQMPANNFVVYVAKGIDFKPAQGTGFQSAPEDPRVQTFVVRNVHPGQAIGFSVSGEGQMPQDAQGAGGGQQAGMGASENEGANGVGSGPGGGLGAPIGTPDPLTKYKWWILALLTLLLITGSAFLLRQRGEATLGGHAVDHELPIAANPVPVFVRTDPRPAGPAAIHRATRSSANAALLNMLKEEMFAIEQEKVTGDLSMEDYTTIKAGLEALLKRTLQAPGSATHSRVHSETEI